MLKIDKSFVGANDTDHLHDEELEKVIVELAKTLHLEIVAEGIERKEQLLRLQGLTCEFGQGFYFGKPVLPERDGCTDPQRPLTSSGVGGRRGDNRRWRASRRDPGPQG